MTTSLHLFSLFSSPSSTKHTPPLSEPLICQEARALGLALVQNSRPKRSQSVRQAFTEKHSVNTRQQRLLVVTGQHWRCHQRHVIPALRRSDANPYLPQQLFHRRADGTADVSQPTGNLSAQYTPSFKEHIQSRTRLRPAVNIYAAQSNPWRQD